MNVYQRTGSVSTSIVSVPPLEGSRFTAMSHCHINCGQQLKSQLGSFPLPIWASLCPASTGSQVWYGMLVAHMAMFLFVMSFACDEPKVQRMICRSQPLPAGLNSNTMMSLGYESTLKQDRPTFFNPYSSIHVYVSVSDWMWFYQVLELDHSKMPRCHGHAALPNCAVMTLDGLGGRSSVHRWNRERSTGSKLMGPYLCGMTIQLPGILVVEQGTRVLTRLHIG